MDTGAQKIDDAAELAQVQAQAKRVNLKSLLAAVVLTGLGFALPF
jgi:hypothetical protein